MLVMLLRTEAVLGNWVGYCDSRPEISTRTILKIVEKTRLFLHLFYWQLVLNSFASNFRNPNLSTQRPRFSGLHLSRNQANCIASKGFLNKLDI